MSEELGNIYERYNHNDGFLYKPFSFHVISGSRDCILLGSMVGNRFIVKPKQGLYISYQKTEWGTLWVIFKKTFLDRLNSSVWVRINVARWSAVPKHFWKIKRWWNCVVRVWKALFWGYHPGGEIFVGRLGVLVGRLGVFGQNRAA